MIRKKISILAGCILLASQSYGAITAGSAGTAHSSLVLGMIDTDATLGNVSTYWIELAPNALNVLDGNGLSISLSAPASAFLTNHADEWFMFGNIEDAGPFISDSPNSIYGHFGDNVGTVYADTTPEGGKLASSQLFNDMGVLRNLLSTIEGETEVVGYKTSVRDFPAWGSFAFSGITNDINDVANIHYSQTNPVQRELTPIESQIMSASGGNLEAWFDGTTFNVGAPVPIPATAWLFGSALIGLAGFKRKK